MLPLNDIERRRMRTPVITIALILINVVVFLFELQHPNPQALIETWGAVPQQISRGEGLLTLLTSMFLHGGWLHLISNMLYLWVFGDNIEDALGHVRYLLFYLVSGVAASLAHVFLSPDSPLPGVGASGAISGVLAAYLILFGTTQVRVLVGFFITTVPAFILIGFWIILQFINGAAAIAQTAQTGGVAYAAHIGGFITGLILTFLLRATGQMERRRTSF